MAEKPLTRSESHKSKYTMDDVYLKLVASEKNTNDRLSKIENDQKQILGEIKTQLREMKQAQKGFADQLKATRQDVNVVKKRCDAADNQTKSLAKVVESLRAQVETLSSEKLHRNIRITGFSNGQFDAHKMVRSIGSTLGVDVIDADVEGVHTFNTKHGQHVIVTFAATAKAEAMLSARKGKSIFTDEIELEMGRRQIYIQEDLTRSAQQLLFNARKLKQSHGYKFVWSKKGKVYARASETSRAIRIDSLAQLEKLTTGQLVDNKEREHEAAERTEDEEEEVNLNRTIINYMM